MHSALTPQYSADYIYQSDYITKATENMDHPNIVINNIVNNTVRRS